MKKKTQDEKEAIEPRVQRIVMPRSPGDLRLGDYVFATRWPDADWNDPWAVGFVGVIGKNYVELREEDGRLIEGVGIRGFPFAVRISSAQGASILGEYPDMERSPFDAIRAAQIIRAA